MPIVKRVRLLNRESRGEERKKRIENYNIRYVPILVFDWAAYPMPPDVT